VTYPQKAPVVGIPVSTTSYQGVLDAISSRPRDRAMVVTVCNVHSVMSARRNYELRDAIGESEIATPDGVPLVWGLRRLGRPEQSRVYGPELMRRALVESEERGWKHYLYGSTPETLNLLEKAIESLAPMAQIVGSHSPPFRQLTDDEAEAALDAIRASDADIVWVGLGMPKQELWMHAVRDRLTGIAVVGVGAAFDFIAGTKKQAPGWVQRAGMEWLYRLAQEPRRLWRRYIWNNPMFAVLLVEQILRTRLRRST
jgi:N-acetylglucosaminyldiphosphoundecaprenol N-acetyl-beta-D-mannosaminyltransferase